MSEIIENPRGGCVLAGINSVLGAIDRVCPIYHAGPGCCMQSTASDQGQSGNKNSSFVSSVSIPSTNMLEREVVFGGTKKLQSTIQGALDIIDADAYFVLTGCTAGIIGDDIKSIGEGFKEKGYPVYPIDTPGFAGDSNLGYEVVWNAMIDQVIEEGVPKEEGLINVFGIIPYHDPFWSGNLEEIARLLRKLGLKVNTFFTEHQGIETIRKSSGAVLNLIIHPWILKGPAGRFEEKFGVPFLRYPGLPIGASDTRRFILEVAHALKLDDRLVNRVIEEEEDYVYHYLAQAIGALSWKKFAVVGDASIAVGITRYLANDYSFTPVLVVISEPVFRQEDKDRILSELTDLEYARPPKVVFSPDQHEINIALLDEEDITLIIGSSNEEEISSLKEVQCIAAAFPIKDRLIFNRAYAGYRGSLTLIEDLYDNL
ncbi:nitrogenase component 1 [Lacrimispora indolis]|uniref:nitrogenase component 1 n=1 Tax=Lacrimispora indolis TaxID=69825 RepID=UPI000425A53D|nr:MULTISPECIES: nitrogenase component 1 [Lachnospiraceae]